MSGDSYSQRQSVRDAQHAKAYREWVASLPEDELARLTALGLAEPLRDDHRASGTGLDDDIANSPAASVAAAEPQDEPEPAEPSQPPAVSPPSQEALWDALRRLLGEILVMPNRSLTVECLAVVSGLSYVGDSLTEIARRHRVTRAAVSKRCVDLTERLSLPPSRAMRSLTARKAYREAQLRRYAKEQRR
jgi:hypothetical protein